MKKRPVLIVIVVLALIEGGSYYASMRQSSNIVLTGIVTTDEVIVSSEIQGRLQQLKVDEGDLVTKGELLAQIQPEEWEADMAFYDSSVQQSSAEMAQAKADLENAQLNYERMKGLLATHVESQQDYDQARTSYDSVLARVDSAQKQYQ